MNFNLSVKDGGDINKSTPQMFWAMVVVARVYFNYGYSCVVTSGQDSIHGPGTLHPTGNAQDYRIWRIQFGDIPLATLTDMCAEIRDALGPDYDVVLEKDHIHVEFDPK